MRGSRAAMPASPAWIELLDGAGARALVLFLLAFGLFLNRQTDREPAAADALFPETAQPSETAPRPVPVRAPINSWAEVAREAAAPIGTTPPPPETAVERAKTVLVRSGLKTAPLIAMLSSYADRRAWFEARRAYESALAQGDAAAAIAVLKAALEKAPQGNPMLRRELLEKLLPLTIASGDIAAAEASFRELVAVRASIGKMWVEEMRANPELAKRMRADPHETLRIPTSDEIAILFRSLGERGGGGRQMISHTPAEWAKIEARVEQLRLQGKLGENEARAFQQWRGGAPK